MEHKEFRRNREEGRVTVVCIHGILGSPNHFTDYLQRLPLHCSVRNLLLEGHGKTVKDFSKATMTDWKNQVREEIEGLKQGNQTVVIVAHSMGCLFGMQMATQYSPVVKGLFLLAPPLVPVVTPRILVLSFRMIFDRWKPDDPVMTASKNACSIVLEKNLALYIGWARNFCHLLQEAHVTRKTGNSLKSKTWVFLSERDEVVLKRSGKYFERNENVTVFHLDRSCHYVYDSEDYKYLLERFCEWMGFWVEEKEGEGNNI